MPEMIEVEAYRQLACRALGRRIARTEAPDAWYLKRGLEQEDLSLLVGGCFTSAQRRGKLLLLPTASAQGDVGPTLGLRFGMSGRLLVDGVAGVDELVYARAQNQPRYERFRVLFEDGGSLVMSDPRRLGGVEIDPGLARLGPDAATVTVRDLRVALGASRAPLKARLMDQSRLAGVGNLIADEVLWECALSPLRPAGALDAGEQRALARGLRAVVARLSRRGGSHTGDLADQRRQGGVCPLDGAPLASAKVGGRTTWWCPQHQH